MRWKIFEPRTLFIVIKQNNRIEKTGRAAKKCTNALAEGFSEYGRLFIINRATRRNAILYVNLQVLIRYTFHQFQYF